MFIFKYIFSHKLIKFYLLGLIIFSSNIIMANKGGDDLEGNMVDTRDSGKLSHMAEVYDDSFDDYFVGKVVYPNWFQTSDFMNYQEDLETALEAGKKGMFFLFTTQGCPYCDQFIHLSLKDPEIAKTVQKNFTSTGMEIFSDVEITNFKGEETSAKDFAKSAGVQFTPTIIFYGKEGEKLFQSVGYQDPERFKHILNYVSEGHYRSQTIREYVKAHSKPPYKATSADSLVSGLYQKAIAERLFDKNTTNFLRDLDEPKRPLVVLFEEENCQDCVDFRENILPIKKVRHLLKQFQVVKLDANDTSTQLTTPNNIKTTPAKWVEALDIQRLPAVIFFDAKGRQVLKTDAVLRQKRMVYSCKYVLDNAYDKGWTYQRYGRYQEILKKQAALKETTASKSEAKPKPEEAKPVQ